MDRQEHTPKPPTAIAEYTGPVRRETAGSHVARTAATDARPPRAAMCGPTTATLTGLEPTLDVGAGVSKQRRTCGSLIVESLGGQASSFPGVDDVIVRIPRAHRGQMAPQFVAHEARPERPARRP